MGLARAVRVVSGVTLLSRFGGLLREVLVARLLGVTPLGDAFSSGFAIPNMFRRLFGEGALAGAFIPAYTVTYKKDRDLSDRFASLTIVLLAMATSGVTLIAEAALLVVLLAGTHTPERAHSIQLIMLMLPYMPMVCIAAILGGMLQVHGKFGASASGALLLNIFICAVAGVYFLIGRKGDMLAAITFGIASVLSGVTQVIWFTRLLRPFVSWKRDTRAARDLTRTMLRRFIPVMIGLGALQLATMVDVVIAMWPTWVGPTIWGHQYPLDTGAQVVLNAAQRLYQFPLGVFGIAVATAVFPMLSRHADEPEHFADTLRRGIRLSLYIGLPASLGLMLVREPLMAVTYSGGQRSFDAAAVARATAVLLGYAPAVWAYSLNHVFTRAFYAKGDTRTPMKVSIGMVTISTSISLVLIWWLSEAGMAWATSIAATVQCVTLGWLAHRRWGVAIIDAETARGIGRIVLTAGLMAGAVGAAAWLWPSATTWLGHAARLGVLSAIGAAVYAGLSKALRAPELGWLLHRERGGKTDIAAAMGE